MKFKVCAVILFLGAYAGIVVAQSETSTTQAPVAVNASCVCGPTEHWFFKACVKNYNKMFDAGLTENYDAEGLSENLQQAIEMLAAQMQFITADGQPLIPAINAQGKLHLPMGKNPDFMLCKKILRQVDVTTTLSAQELFDSWMQQLVTLKSAE